MSEAKYKLIDMESWPRKAHYNIFRNSLLPQYCISFDVDVTAFKQSAKRRGLPFSLSMIYALAKCANGIENFRYRFLDGRAVLYDEIGTSFTYMRENDDLFMQINVPMRPSAEEFSALALDTIAHQSSYFTAPPPNDSFIFSAIPWIPYNHISHTFSGNKDASSPMFDWGKFTERDKRLMMPLSVQVHHSFVDGVHIGQFYKMLQEYLDDF